MLRVRYMKCMRLRGKQRLLYLDFARKLTGIPGRGVNCISIPMIFLI